MELRYTIYLRHLWMAVPTIILLEWFRLIVRMHGTRVERAWWNPLVVAFFIVDVAYNFTAATFVFWAPGNLHRPTLSMRVQDLCDDGDEHGMFIAGVINGILPGHIRTKPKD